MKKFENWPIFDEVIRRTKMCQFLGHTEVHKADKISFFIPASAGFH